MDQRSWNPICPGINKVFWLYNCKGTYNCFTSMLVFLFIKLKASQLPSTVDKTQWLSTWCIPLSVSMRRVLIWCYLLSAQHHPGQPCDGAGVSGAAARAQQQDQLCQRAELQRDAGLLRHPGHRGPPQTQGETERGGSKKLHGGYVGSLNCKKCLQNI